VSSELPPPAKHAGKVIVLQIVGTRRRDPPPDVRWENGLKLQFIVAGTVSAKQAAGDFE
jgi:hypothetical protein